MRELDPGILSFLGEAGYARKILEIAVLVWQRVRESNPCTSLESAVAFIGVRFAVTALLLHFAIQPARLTGIAHESFLIAGW